MDYEFLVDKVPKSQKAIGTDKGLAKIGDSIVNLVYSIAKSIYLTRNNLNNVIIRTGQKVSKAILAESLKKAKMKSFAKNRASAHDLANTAEAVIAYVWLANHMRINEMIEILVQNLSGNIEHRYKEIDNAAFAFTQLLSKVKKFLPEKEL